MVKLSRPCVWISQNLFESIQWKLFLDQLTSYSNNLVFYCLYQANPDSQSTIWIRIRLGQSVFYVHFVPSVFISTFHFLCDQIWRIIACVSLLIQIDYILWITTVIQFTKINSFGGQKTATSSSYYNTAVILYLQCAPG